MEEKKIQIKNLEINYKKFGGNLNTSEGVKETPIFLVLHGWGGSSDSWKELCECFEKKNDCEIYVIDFPGFGKSEPLKEIWKVDNYADLVDEFIQKLNIKKCRLIAHSFGGRVAIKLAVREPSWLEKIYLCDAAGIKRKLTIKQIIAKNISKIGKIIFNNRILRPLGEFFRKLLYKAIREHDYYNCSDENSKKTFQNVIAEDLKPLLKNIKIPALIIWGEKDSYTPLEDGMLMNKEIANSKMEVIKGVGHGVHLKAVSELCDILTKDAVRDTI